VIKQNYERRGIVNYQYLWRENDQSKLLTWFNALGNNRGDRARLRRAETPDDILLTEPFFNFLHGMPEFWAEQRNLPVAAMVAAVLAHVKKNDDKKSFAAQLATPKSGTDNARMSELRFRQLQKSRTPDEFFRRLVRAVKLAEGTVNVVSLADSIWHWMNEYYYGTDAKPFNRLAVRWANDYYTAN